MAAQPSTVGRTSLTVRTPISMASRAFFTVSAMVRAVSRPTLLPSTSGLLKSVQSCTSLTAGYRFSLREFHRALIASRRRVTWSIGQALRFGLPTQTVALHLNKAQGNCSRPCFSGPWPVDLNYLKLEGVHPTYPPEASPHRPIER